MEPFLVISLNICVKGQKERLCTFVDKGQVRLGEGLRVARRSQNWELPTEGNLPWGDHHYHLQHDKTSFQSLEIPWLGQSSHLDCSQMDFYSTFVLFTAPFSPKRKTCCKGLLLCFLPSLPFLSLSLNKVVRCELFPALHS